MTPVNGSVRRSAPSASSREAVRTSKSRAGPPVTCTRKPPPGGNRPTVECIASRNAGTKSVALAARSAATTATKNVVRWSSLMRLESGVVRYETVRAMNGSDSAAKVRRSSRSLPGPLSIGSGAWSVTTKNAAIGSANELRMSALAWEASEPAIGSPST